MSLIFGSDGDPLVNFTLDLGSTMRLWWWGFGEQYNVGFPFAPSIATVSNRVVADNHGMEYVEWPDHTGLLYTTDVHAEDTRHTGIAAVFRMQIGHLS
jgi:hypothetical protein